jgi:hypothetical protein
MLLSPTVTIADSNNFSFCVNSAESNPRIEYFNIILINLIVAEGESLPGVRRHGAGGSTFYARSMRRYPLYGFLFQTQ